MLSVKTLPHFAQLQKVCGFLFVQVTNICGLPRRQTQNRKFKSKTHWTNQTRWPLPSQYYNKPTSCEKKIIVSFKVTSYQESWQFRTSSALFVRHSTCHEWLASNKQLAWFLRSSFVSRQLCSFDLRVTSAQIVNWVSAILRVIWRKATASYMKQLRKTIDFSAIYIIGLSRLYLNEILNKEIRWK